MEMFTTIPEGIIQKAIAVIITITIALLLNILFRSLIKIPLPGNPRLAKTYTAFLRNCLTLIISVITAYIVFLLLEIDITPLLASAGVIGVVVGIGARSVFEDLIAGFFLTTQSTLAIGDFVNIGNGIEGTVTNIGLKNLTLRGVNGAMITIPNGQIKNIVNLTSGRAVNAIAIPVKGVKSVDTVLTVFESVLKDIQKNEDYQISPDSKIVGVTNIDGNGITVMTELVTPYAYRGKVDNEYRYMILKALEKKKIYY